MLPTAPNQPLRSNLAAPKHRPAEAKPGVRGEGPYQPLVSRVVPGSGAHAVHYVDRRAIARRPSPSARDPLRQVVNATPQRSVRSIGQPSPEPVEASVPL